HRSVTPSSLQSKSFYDRKGSHRFAGGEKAVTIQSPVCAPYKDNRAEDSFRWTWLHSPKWGYRFEATRRRSIAPPTHSGRLPERAAIRPSSNGLGKTPLVPSQYCPPRPHTRG